MPYADRSGSVLVVSAIFLAFATLFTALRCVSKFGIRKRVDTDDLVTILAWVSHPSHPIPSLFLGRSLAAATLSLASPRHFSFRQTATLTQRGQLSLAFRRYYSPPLHYPVLWLHAPPCSWGSGLWLGISATPRPKAYSLLLFFAS